MVKTMAALAQGQARTDLVTGKVATSSTAPMIADDYGGGGEGVDLT